VQNATDKDGNANSAWTITDNGPADSIRQTLTVSADTETYTVTLYVGKTVGATTYPMLSLAFGSAAYSQYFVDTNEGELTARTTIGGTGGVISSHDSNFWKVSWNITNPGNQTVLNLDIYPAAATVLGTYNNNATGSCVFDAFQLEIGSSATAYQKVVSEYDVTEAGVDSLDYLSFSTNDQLLTADIDFSSIVEMSAFAAATKLTDTRSVITQYQNNATGAAIQLEHSDTIFGGGNGSYKALLRRTTGVQSEDFSGFVTPTNYVGTQTNVLAMTASRTGFGNSVVTFRVDGATPASNVTNVTGTSACSPADFGTGKISLGSFVAGNVPLDGYIYGLIVRGSLSTTDEITNTEAYLGARSGFSAPTITGLPTIGVS
jgi:hypothetical protein